MLRSLSIRDLAILPEARLEFEPGFTAITGETGAGKSILMGALKLVLGAKAKTDLIRQGAEKLKVEAVFSLPPSPELRALLSERELDAEDELVLERELTAAGKSRARVNGTLVPLADLEAVGRHLADLHGQHEQQRLLDPAAHVGYLDGFGGLTGEAAAYGRLYGAWRAAEQALTAEQEQARRLREQADFLRFQLGELDKAALREGEEEEAEAELKMLSGLEKIAAARLACFEALEGQAGALGAISRLGKELEALARHLGGEAMAAQAARLRESEAALADLRADLRKLDLPARVDPARLDALNGRMALLQKLRSKYKTDFSGLVALRDKRREEVARLDNAETESAALAEARDEALREARRGAASLSEKRKAAAARFDAEVNARLQRLGMEGSRFETLFTPEGGEEGLNPQGRDRVEFFLAANPGEPARPLRQSASGGEISRVMLAVKAALAAGDPSPVLVFDELDAGIGGATGLRVGEALSELARHHQVLVITHLHQVAAQAAHQHRVEKRLEGGRTVTRVLPLNPKERAAELARMMGDESSETALRHARQLLKRAEPA